MAEQTMIERVADAVLADLLNRRGIKWGFNDIDDDVMAEIRQAIGRVAIAAMRDPSTEIADAIEVFIDGWVDPSGEQVWNAGVDAALAEGADPADA